MGKAVEQNDDGRALITFRFPPGLAARLVVRDGGGDHERFLGQPLDGKGWPDRFPCPKPPAPQDLTLRRFLAVALCYVRAVHHEWGMGSPLVRKADLRALVPWQRDENGQPFTEGTFKTTYSRELPQRVFKRHAGTCVLVLEADPENRREEAFRINREAFKLDTTPSVVQEVREFVVRHAARDADVPARRIEPRDEVRDGGTRLVELFDVFERSGVEAAPVDRPVTTGGRRRAETARGTGRGLPPIVDGHDGSPFPEQAQPPVVSLELGAPTSPRRQAPEVRWCPEAEEVAYWSFVREGRYEEARLTGRRLRELGYQFRSDPRVVLGLSDSDDPESVDHKWLNHASARYIVRGLRTDLEHVSYWIYFWNNENARIQWKVLQWRLKRLRKRLRDHDK